MQNNKFILFAILIIFLLITPQINTHKQKHKHVCKHDELEIPVYDKLIPEYEEDKKKFFERRRLGVSNPEKIRITFDTTNL